MFKYLFFSFIFYSFFTTQIDSSGENTSFFLFSKNEVLENDIVINEIMFDPTPRVNLPEMEYVEIFNNSDRNILLDGWKLIVGKKEYDIPVNTLQSGEYLLLTKDATLFPDVNVVEVPISSLTNSGTTLKITTSTGVVVDQVSYSVSMFSDEAKKDGGWSLELINPKNYCIGNDNWDGATSSLGGTPGLTNSIFNLDFYPNTVNEISQVSANDNVSSISVLFKGFIDESSISVETDYSRHYDYVYEANPNGSSEITINLESELGVDIKYFILNNLLSCDGSEIITDTIWASNFEDIEKGNILVNEVMFNPKEGSSEFVEIFNNSNKFLSLRNVYLSNFTTDDDTSEKIGEKRLSDKNIIFPPNTYFTITKNADAVRDVYKSGVFYTFIELTSLPKLNNEDGNVAVLDRAFNFVDKMVYTSEMHVGLITSEKQKGVSLERIKFNSPSLDFNNWTSASQSSGGATPSLINSVSPVDYIVEDVFEVYPEVFTPNNDGVFDVVELKFKLEKSGVVANVKIFNSNGVFVKEIVNNFLMGSGGSFIWNGMNKDNSLCEKGIYIFWVELFDAEGNVSNYKEICVLG